MGLLTPVWNYVDALVPLTARQDALATARYRAFISPRLFGCLASLAGLPVYVAIRGVPTAPEFGVFVWLTIPVLVVYYLARTGRYEAAHILSSLSLTGAVTLVALFSGGLTSFACAWLMIVPLESAVTGSRRLVFAAVAAVLTAVAGLLLLDITGLLPAAAANERVLGAFGLVSACLYGAGLALAAESLSRAGSLLLDEEKCRYRMLARDMSDVILCYGRNGAVLFASPPAEMLFGAPVSGLTGHGLLDRVHVADRPAYLTALADSAALAEERSLEFRIRQDAGAGGPGRYIWVEMMCRPQDGASDSARSNRDVIAVLRDISERKSQEQSLEGARSRSERAGAAKSQLIATMSHELRTPLNAIIGFSEIMMNNAQNSDARTLEYARLINMSGHHLLAVANGVLDVSRLETGNFTVAPESFSPGPAIENCADMLALKAREAGVEIKLRLGRGLPDVTADRRAFNQILINLVSNAIKFNRQGGDVAITAQCEGAQLLLSVEDTGIGIVESDLLRLGEPFFQASSSYDRHYEGSGLGLSIVRGLLELHGGVMEISSRFGEGTRVKIRLPLDCAATAAREQAGPDANISRLIQSTAKNWMKKSA